MVNTLDFLNISHSKKYPMKLWRKKLFHLYDQQCSSQNMKITGYAISRIRSPILLCTNSLFKSGHIRDFQVIWLTFIPFFLQNICLLHIIIITNNNYSISHQYNISNFHYHCLKVSIIILGSWSLLPECFIHCLHENQVDLPEYLLAFLAQKWKMAIWTNRGGGGGGSP